MTDKVLETIKKSIEIQETLEELYEEIQRLFKEATKEENIEKIPALCIKCRKAMFVEAFIESCPNCGNELLYEHYEFSDISAIKKLIEHLLNIKNDR